MGLSSDGGWATRIGVCGVGDGRRGVRENWGGVWAASARGGSEDFGRGDPLDGAGHADDAAVGLDDLVADDFMRLIRAALDQHVGPNRLEQRVRRVLIKDHDVLDAGQGGQHRGTVVLADDRPLGAFETTHALVAVDAHEQRISQQRGFGQMAGMADMQQIEASVGEHDLVAAAAIFFGEMRGLFARDNLLGGGSAAGHELRTNFVAADDGHAGAFDLQPGRHITQAYRVGWIDAGRMHSPIMAITMSPAPVIS